MAEAPDTIEVREKNVTETKKEAEPQPDEHWAISTAKSVGNFFFQSCFLIIREFQQQKKPALTKVNSFKKG